MSTSHTRAEHKMLAGAILVLIGMAGVVFYTMPNWNRSHVRVSTVSTATTTATSTVPAEETSTVPAQ